MADMSAYELLLCCEFQDSVCLDSGSYMLNFAGCTHCGESGHVRIVNKSNKEENEEETTIYQR